MRAVLRNRNYRLLWIGRAANMLGGQFSMIATPWLVLQLTGSALAMGTVMAVSGIPRAAFMLVGGVLTDRFSPRLIMILNSILFTALLVLESTLVLTDLITLWMIYVFALVAGALDAFYFPASATMIPQIVDEKDLPSANALIQGTMQGGMFLGPVVAGGLIAILSATSAPTAELAESTAPTAQVAETIDDIEVEAPEATPAAEEVDAPEGLRGIGIAFGINACTFLFSALTLWMMRIPKREPDPGESEEKTGMWSSIREGMTFVWQDRSLRAVFLLFGLVNFFTIGPIAIGIPYLANARFEEGAAAFGIIMSGFGGGALIGVLLVAVLPDLPPKGLGTFVRGVVTVQGICLILLAFAPTTAVAVAVTFVMGSGNGYMMIMMITWFQRRTPLAILGRIMSLLMFVMSGLQPFSMALAGVFVGLNAVVFFIIVGIIIALIAQFLCGRAAIREMGIR